MTHWANTYIGQPWKAGLFDPTSGFDCWDLVRKVYKEQFAIDLPAIPVETDNLRQQIKTIKNHPQRNLWKSVRKPSEGDIALLRQSRHPIHVGVWLNIDGGGILHCEKTAGTIFQTLNSLHLSGWKVEGFYSYVGKRHHSSQPL